MKLYDQTDFDKSRKEKQRSLMQMLLFMLPFLGLAIAAFVLRIEWLCTLGCVAAGAVAIFLYDLRVKPALRYSAYLAEIHSGLTRQTLGTLIRIGRDPVYQDGVNLYEVILNIYEDMDEEGERRFLIDSKKEIPQEWLQCDVIVTSHGSSILEARLANGGNEQA